MAHVSRARVFCPWPEHYFCLTGGRDKLVGFSTRFCWRRVLRSVYMLAYFEQGQRNDLVFARLAHVCV